MTSKIGEAATYAGGATAVGAAWGVHEWAAVIGASVAVVGFIVNLWFRVVEFRTLKEASRGK